MWKLIKKLFRFLRPWDVLWPEKKRWDTYYKEVKQDGIQRHGSFEAKMRTALKNMVFTSPLKGHNPVEHEVLDEFAEIDHLPPLTEWPTLRTGKWEQIGGISWVNDNRMTELNAPDPSLPKICTNCGAPTSPSKIDDRLVACIPCKMVFMTDEARDDPNIQRDLTHANLGVTPRMTTTKPCGKWEQMVRSWWEQSDKSTPWEEYWAELKSSGPDLKGMYGQAIDIIRDREIREAQAFGEGYTRGKYGVSREAYNQKKRKEYNNCERYFACDKCPDSAGCCIPT